MAKMILTETEIVSMLEAVLCDGLYHMDGYGFSLEYDDKEYLAAVDKLREEKGPDVVLTIEDVQLKMLQLGYGLTFVDEENDGEYTTVLTMDLVRENIKCVPPRLLMKIAEEDYDAGDADAILQYLLFRDEIFS